MYKNDTKMISKWCMGGPEELRRSNDRVKGLSGMVLGKFWSCLGIDFEAKSKPFSSVFLLFSEVELSIDISESMEANLNDFFMFLDV